MAVSVVATVGSANANSYITVATGDAIANTMVGTLSWNSASNDNKGRALITATNGLETLGWIGARATETQALAWPRSGVACSDKAYDDDEIPREIELATFDLANALLDNPALLRSAPSSEALVTGVPNRDLRRLKLDVMELEWRDDRSASTTKPVTPLTVLPHLATILGCLTVSVPSTNVLALVRS
ncbi:MAG: DnaT-like ssDNA-binding protein [Candidatus Limnocylindrus sp.]